MKEISKLFILVVSSALLPTTFSFSSGAGQCLVGEASVSGSHLTQQNVRTGSLEEGGYTMKLLSSTLMDGSLLTVGGDDLFDIPLEITGPEFKGILVNIDGFTEDDVFPGAGLQFADFCRDQTAVTHEDASPKTKAEIGLTVGKEASARVDITVVVQNSNGLSEYYYSQFKFETVSRNIFAFNNDCLDRLQQADTNGDFILTKDEYYNFVVLMGEERCYSPEGQLSDDQLETYKQIGCTYCVSNNEPIFCCLNPDEISVAGADSYDMASSSQKATLTTICQYTNSNIPPSCDKSESLVTEGDDLASSTTLSPSGSPTSKPTSSPSGSPTLPPSGSPTSKPTNSPSNALTQGSLNKTTETPTITPSSTVEMPGEAVEVTASDVPSTVPSDLPSMIPSDLPSMIPSDLPSLSPSSSETPTGMPFETEKVTLTVPRGN